MLRVLLASLAVVFSILPSCAQAEGNGASVAEIVAKLKDTHPKVVVLLLDVSESMKVDDYNRKMHDALTTILTDAVGEGDQAILYTFGSGFKKLFDATPTTPAARRKLADQVPLHTEPGEGTNIRQPHHEALKLARDSGKTPFVVILTDSFNDPPKNTPTAYTAYQKYYTPGKLDIYPATPENRDYEALLGWMQRSGGRTFGIGVEILPNSRPKERFKVAPREGERATPEPRARVSAPSGPTPGTDGFPMGWLVALIGLGAAGAAFCVLRPRAMPLRIAGSGSSARDFDVRGNTVVRLGGEGAAGALDAYPLAGIKETVATVRGGRGQFTLSSQPTSTARVYHNGLPLEKPSPLRYGDEVRVVVVDSKGAIVKENRLKFSDPTKAF